MLMSQAMFKNSEKKPLSIDSRCKGRVLSISFKFQHLRVFITAVGLLPGWPCNASDISSTYGAGSDRYQSYAFNAGVDLPQLPLQFDLDYYHIRTEGAEVLTENGAGLTWNPTDWASANFRYVTINEPSFELSGNEYGAFMFLSHLWQGRLHTRLDIGLGDYEYALNVRPAVRALIAGRVPEQRRYSLGLSQNLTQDIYLYGAYDTYRYSSDPAFLANLLTRRFRQSSNAASVLVSFPDLGRTLGIGWHATEKLTVDVSYADTDTVIGQKQDSQKLRLNYRTNNAVSFNVALTLSNADAVTRPNGVTQIQASDSTIIEFGIAYSFP